MTILGIVAILLCLAGMIALVSPPKSDEHSHGETQIIAVMLVAAGVGIIVLIYSIGPLMAYFNM